MGLRVVECAVTGADIGGRISASRGDAEVRPQGKENRRKQAAEGGSDARSGIENVVIDKKFSRRLLAACERTVPEDSAMRREIERERERERECSIAPFRNRPHLKLFLYTLVQVLLFQGNLGQLNGTYFVRVIASSL
jgi:hypothetical protein